MTTSLPIPSAETIKKWIDYWRKFKGKRVKIFLKSGLKHRLNLNTQVGPQLLETNKYGINSTYEQEYLDTLIGTIENVVESPFGIWLKDVSIPEEKEVEGAFIPMFEIVRMYSLKKERGQEVHDTSTKANS